MRIVKIILIVAVLLFLGIQLIRPERNKSNQLLPTDISRLALLPDSVGSLLQTACYDCHSNNTRYPWYMNVQPMAWLMAKHIREGKEELNFSEFGSYSKRRQLSKLKAVAGTVKDGSMPIASYTWVHRNAKLPAESKASIIDWSLRTRDSLEIKN